MAESDRGGIIRTTTFTVIDFQELEKLIEEHLGVETQSMHNSKDWKDDCFSVVADLELSNDQKTCLGTYDEIVRYGLDEILTYKYVHDLMVLGEIPKDNPVLLDVCW